MRGSREFMDVRAASIEAEFKHELYLGYVGSYDALNIQYGYIRGLNR